MPLNPARLRALREARGENREQTAVACRCSYQTLVNYELGGSDNPSAAIVERIARHFDVSIDSLFDRAAS